MDADRVPVSIVCVFNDALVRENCLDRSIDRFRAESIVDYVAIDNTAGAFDSAGAALMEGATRARFDHIAFVHQDVVLHSMAAIERAASWLGDAFGVVGAIGITADGRYFGRIRDRVVLLGESATRPVEVDSLDEVLFVVDRHTLEREPLSTASELSWHGYAVEYGLRMRREGRRAGAVSIPLTHNSLTTNLERLAEAHDFLASQYPEHETVQTTCGVIASHGERRKRLASHRWRYRWVEGSIQAARIRRRTGVSRIVLSDIRLDIDEMLHALPSKSMLVVNLDRGGKFEDDPSLHLRLQRGDASIEVSALTFDEIANTITVSGGPDRNWNEPLLVTDLDESDVVRLAAVTSDSPMTIGLHRDVGCWLLVGAALGAGVKAWSKPAAIPFWPRRPRF